MRAVSTQLIVAVKRGIFSQLFKVLLTLSLVLLFYLYNYLTNNKRNLFNCIRHCCSSTRGGRNRTVGAGCGAPLTILRARCHLRAAGAPHRTFRDHSQIMKHDHIPLQRELRRARSAGRSLMANDSLKCIFPSNRTPHPHLNVASAHEHCSLSH